MESQASNELEKSSFQDTAVNSMVLLMLLLMLRTQQCVELEVEGNRERIAASFDLCSWACRWMRRLM